MTHLCVLYQRDLNGLASTHVQVDVMKNESSVNLHRSAMRLFFDRSFECSATGIGTVASVEGNRDADRKVCVLLGFVNQSNLEEMSVFACMCEEETYVSLSFSPCLSISKERITKMCVWSLGHLLPGFC